MPNIKPFNVKFLVDEVFKSPSGSGYVLDFSDRTFDEFFDSFDIDIAADLYKENGGSMANRLRTFLKLSDGPSAAKALRELWEYRDGVYGPYDETDLKVTTTKNKFFELVKGIETEGDLIRTDSIEKFVESETLEELIAAIHRDIQANKPQVALDRLHTYCMKKFAYLLVQRGGKTDTNEGLHSRAGKYITMLEKEGRFQDTTIRMMRMAVTVFEGFNWTRNNASLAHDNELVEKHEARFIFDSIADILRFLKNIETSRFGA
jgi:hypothetical protein